MDPVFKKMNFKNQPEVCVLNAPESFLAHLDAMKGLTAVKHHLDHVGALSFGLALVTKQAEVDSIAADFAEKLSDDGIIDLLRWRDLSGKKCHFFGWQGKFCSRNGAYSASRMLSGLTKSGGKRAFLPPKPSTATSLIWFSYPKGSSKQYKFEFNRDNGWAVLGELGYEPVRMVSIDEDWTALRFRRVERIKKMSRSFAITKVGKERTLKNDGSTKE